MIRHYAQRRITTAVLGTLFALGVVAPAFAQRNDDDKDRDDRKPRKEQRQQSNPPSNPQPRQEPARIQPANRPMPERNENWGDRGREV